MSAELERFLWERAKGESAKAFQAFALYRDAGPDRSAPDVAKALGKSYDLMKRWSAKWQWLDRARAYDVYLDHKQRTEREDQVSRQRADMLDRHAKLAAAAMRAVALRIVGDDSGGIKAVSAESLDLPDLARVLDTLVRIERLSLGVHTDHVQQDVGNVDGATFRVRDETPDREGAMEVLTVLAQSGILEMLRDGTDGTDEHVPEGEFEEMPPRVLGDGVE